MAFRSQFGTKLPPTSYIDPPKKQSSNVLHNLLKDAIDTARGIPFGMIELARNPIKSVKLMGKSYEDYYGHGFGHFKTQFMAHPLQPLLDAISIPLILAGGAGIAVKGASTAANLGRSASAAGKLARSTEMMGEATTTARVAEAAALRAESMRFPGLDAAAQRFRKGTPQTTRMVDVPSMPGTSLPFAYSSNLWRRALTKGSMAVLEGMSRGKGHWSPGELGERMLRKTESKRSASTAAASKGQAAVLYESGKLGLPTAEVAEKIAESFRRSHELNALRVDESYGAALANSKRFQDNWEFIYEEPEVPAYAEKRADFIVDTKGQASPAPFVSVPAKPAGVATREMGLGGYEHSQMMNFIDTLGKAVVTGPDPRMARVVNGNLLVVRKGIKDKQMREVGKAAEMFNSMYRNSLSAWKGIILGMSPRYFVNNVIGNASMLVAATNPVEFSRGMFHAVRQVKGNRAAARLERQAGNTLDGLMKKYLPDDWVHSRAGFLQHGALGVDLTAGMRLRHPVKRAAHARLYAVTEQVSYRGPQRVALMGAMHGDKDFRNLYRANRQKGMSTSDAYQAAANKIFSDPRKAAAMEKRVTDWAGQYYHLNDLEKKITAFVPFYTWDRHALRFGKEQVLSRPVSSVVLGHLGAQGDEAADRELGKIPDFMKGAIPVKGHDDGILGFLFGQNILGRKKVMLTAGVNPLAAAADNAAAIASIFGQGPRSAREGVGGQVNPIITGFLAGVTGQRVFSGARAETHGLGPVGGAYEETFGQLPHTKLIRQILGEEPKTTTSKGQPTLYVKGMRQTVSSLFGLNERDFSPQAAERLWRQDHGIKKGRRRKKREARDAVSQLKSSLESNF